MKGGLVHRMLCIAHSCSTKITEQELMKMKTSFYQQLLPPVAFCKFFNRFIPLFQHSFYVVGKKEAVKPLPQNAIGRFKIKKVNQYRTVITGFKMMFMFHDFKISLQLFINKHFIFFHLCYFGSHQPGFEKMPCPPGYCLLFFNQAKPYSCHSIFLIIGHRFFVYTNMTAEVKNYLCRRSDECCKMNCWHSTKFEIRSTMYELVLKNQALIIIKYVNNIAQIGAV